MKNKKFTSILLILALLCTLLAGCGSKNTTKSSLGYAVGDTVIFGSYEQDNSAFDGKEDIEWIVINVEKDGALTLMSKYALDYYPLNTEVTHFTWETCTLRKWLNEDFYNEAFSATEKAKIKTVRLTNESYTQLDIKGGNDTQDKVWLLSVNEVTNEYSSNKVYSYFKDNASRMCASTKYAEAQGAPSDSCRWLLRTTGINYRGFVLAAEVNYDGEIATAVRSYSYAISTLNKVYSDPIRPVIRVTQLQKIDATQLTAKEKDTITSAENIVDGYSVGDIVFFGSYEQDNNPNNGKESIKWIVLDVAENGALTLLSKYGLDCKPYDSVSDSVTWKDCTLRTWLNEDFYNAAFSEEEQANIQTVTLMNEDVPHWANEGGYDTKVYLLSIDELKNYSYFEDYASRRCVPTKYAVAMGVGQSSLYIVDGAKSCCWLLRNGTENGWPNWVPHTHYSAVRPVIQVSPFSVMSAETRAEANEISLESNAVGGTYIFGSYEQDNNMFNGNEPIEWMILDVEQDGTLTLLSKYALDAKPYNTSYTHVTWERCTLRKWLNEDFYNAAFSAEEKMKILKL